MKNKIKIIILLGIIFAVQLFALSHWIQRGFADNFRYSAFDLSLRLVEGIHNDTNMPLWLIRAFHNKVIGETYDIFSAYLQFWNIGFLASFVSLTGVVGIVAQFYYFLHKKKSLLLWLLFAFVFLSPFIEIFNFTIMFPAFVHTALLAIPFVTWSMLGYWQLLKEKDVNTKWIDLLLLFSVWYQLLLFIS